MRLLYSIITYLLMPIYVSYWLVKGLFNPSYREGLPKALVEAGACSRASVTTDVPGCRNIISNNFNGLVVPLKKCPLKMP